MLDYLPWIISIAALILAVVPLPGLARWRLAAALLAVGAGQIYLAVPCLLLVLMIDNGWRIPIYHSAGAMLAIGSLLAAVFMLTVMQEVDWRSWSELTQLGVYVLLYFLLCARVGDGRDLTDLLHACIAASLGTALLALAALAAGLVAMPAIFIDRGSNEASVYLALLGVVPCAVMLVRSRNPGWLLPAGVLILAQYLATSRGSMVVSVLALLVAAFLWTRSLGLRAVAVAGALLVLVRNVPQLASVFATELNFSARERIALIMHGWDLMSERFWTGWGWGSTSRLASTAPTTQQTYPHFHNAYVQLLVELGALGWLVLGLALWLVLRWLGIAAFRLRQPGVTALVACASVGMATACLFDAMLFGADRFVQMVVLLALCTRAVGLGEAAAADRPMHRVVQRPAGWHLAPGA